MNNTTHTQKILRNETKNVYKSLNITLGVIGTSQTCTKKFLLEGKKS